MEIILGMSILNNLRIEYEQRLFTKLLIDSLIDNIVEMLKVSLIKRLLDN